MARARDVDGHEYAVDGPFYHSTSRYRAGRILQQGLRFRRSHEYSGEASEVFLTTNPGLSHAWGDTVLLVDLPDDWSLEEGEYVGQGEYTSVRPIPAQYVSLYKRLRLSPLPDVDALGGEFAARGTLDINEVIDFVSGDERSDRTLRHSLKLIDRLKKDRRISQPDNASLTWVHQESD